METKTITRRLTTFTELMYVILNMNPDSKVAFLKEYRAYQLRMLAKHLVLAAIALTVVILTAVIFAACNSSQQAELISPQERVIESDIVIITVTGGQIVVREIATDRVHNFILTTTRHRGEAPPDETRTHTSTDIVRIYSQGAVLIVYEIATQTIHIV